ncbi:MAG: helix-hairpin-helix domain-containing protein [Anaerovoracaceae bacterium]
MKIQNTLKLVNLDSLKTLVLNNKERLKTAALPVIIGAAVLFFWFYGSGGETPTVTEEKAVNRGETKIETEESALSGAEIYVDIDGEVKSPGVYKVSEGTRLFQVIEMAGGLTESASTEMLNRAEAVYDGQKITVMSKAGYVSDEGNTGSMSGISNGKVNINMADSVTLQTIPGIGPSKAERIIEYRETNGRFTKTEDIKNVTGIGDKTYDSIKNYITV